MGLFDVFKSGKSAKSARKKKGSSSRKRTERSSSETKSWIRKSKQSQTADTSGEKKLTRAERSAANKKAWAEKSTVDAAPKPTAAQTTTASTGPSSRKRSGRTEPETDAAPSTEKKLTRAERSVINKEQYRKQQELEARAAETKTGSKNRRDFFKTRGEHKAYLKSDTWKKTRDKVHTKSQRKCEMCGKAASAVHHIRYSEPGKEHQSHLISVCNSCHRGLHRTHK